MREGFEHATGDDHPDPGRRPRVLRGRLPERCSSRSSTVDADFTLGCRHVPGEPMRIMARDAHRATIVNAAHWVFTACSTSPTARSCATRSRCTRCSGSECIDGVEFVVDRFDFDWELAGKLVRLGYRRSRFRSTYNARGFDDGKKVRFFRDPPTWIAACLRFRFCSLPAQHRDAVVRGGRHLAEPDPRLEGAGDAVGG